MQSNVFRQEVLKPKGIHVSQVIFMYKNYLGSWVSVLSFTMCHRYFSVSLMLHVTLNLCVTGISMSHEYNVSLVYQCVNNTCITMCHWYTNGYVTDITMRH